MSLSDLKPAHFIQSRVHVHCAAAHSAVVEGGGILVEVVTKWEEGEREGGDEVSAVLVEAICAAHWV
jgi:tRNA(Met) C34 N-acetyltransferase TmcA